MIRSSKEKTRLVRLRTNLHSALKVMAAIEDMAMTNLLEIIVGSWLKTNSLTPNKEKGEPGDC